MVSNKNCQHIWEWREKGRWRYCKVCGLNQKGHLLKSKTDMMIPERFAIAMIDDGWILRNKIIWRKANAMPSSAKDRLSNKWEYVFFFVKSKKYYFDLDAVRKPFLQPKSLYNHGKSFNIRVRDAKKGILKEKWGDLYSASEEEVSNYDVKHDMVLNHHGSYPDPLHTKPYNPKGANPGDVLDIPTQPHPFSHFAVYPTTLIEPLVKAGCPKGGVVLDPFAGSGTTGVVAEVLGRESILIEISKEYCQIIEERFKPENLEKTAKLLHEKGQ